MTKIIQSPPPRGQNIPRVFYRWLVDLRSLLTNDGQFNWSQILKTGSKLSDIETRPHSQLQDVLAADDTSTDATATKHVTNLQAKIWTDSADLLPLPMVDMGECSSLLPLPAVEKEASGWDDFVIPVTQGKQGNVGKPDFDFTDMGYLFPKNDTGEILYLVAQLPHSWRQGGNIYPHVHLVQDADVAYTMKADYKWFNPAGDAIPGSWTTYTMSNQVATYSSGSISQILNNATPIDGSGFTISSILLIKLHRDDNVGSNDLLVQSFDFHLEKDGLGSEDEYLK